ncbi:hypothetical protein KFL_008630040 [Klebsormidium nitens]|uniref:Uncharacterized protein n=1 Tax=Klebsormidium nitens TaxID=105231 RepID=A0A1Y1ISR6_KLENI|nr:hypothetical protein KFL_008630040 [Klebsormidium nitens]|eukprot:GAQ91826.1 hypothetical protein KFL_008630040 [Klebsormidium nitens]
MTLTSIAFNRRNERGGHVPLAVLPLLHPVADCPAFRHGRQTYFPRKLQFFHDCLESVAAPQGRQLMVCWPQTPLELRIFSSLCSIETYATTRKGARSG